MARLTTELVLEPPSGADLASRFPSTTSGRAPVLRELLAIITALAGGQMRGRLRLSIDDSAGVKASGTIACSRSNSAAGDKVAIGEVLLTVVDGAADATLGQFSRDTSDTAMATSLVAAINAYGPFKNVVGVTATSSTGTVTVTARQAGSPGNGITLKEAAANASAFTLSGSTLSGGIDAGARQSVTATFSGVGTANDTLTIGAVVLTLKASAGNEDEVTIGGSATATAAGVAAAINANSKLNGLVSASAASGVVTITLGFGGRLGRLVSIAKSSTAITLSAASFAPSTTETAVTTAPLSYDFGVPT